MKNQLIEVLRGLPRKRMWIVELSVPELHSANLRKVGEVLIDAERATQPSRDFMNLVLARLPGCFVLYSGGGSTNPRFEFIPTGIRGHTQIYGCEDKS